MKARSFYNLAKQFSIGGVMMDQIFDWCVNVLVYWAGILGITYKEINVWIFVILWPVLTLILVAIIAMQFRIIRRLLRKQT